MSKYKVGTVPQYVPSVSTIEEQHRSGYLKQNVKVIQLLLRVCRNGGQAIPSWDPAVALGIENKTQVEKAAVCAGLQILYGKVPGKSMPRRCIVLDEKSMLDYLYRVRDYRDKVVADRRKKKP